MKTLRHKFLKPTAVIMAAATLFASCNKDLPEATPIVAPVITGSTFIELIRADTSYSILDSAIKKAGATTIGTLADRTGRFTFYAPDNNAFRLSGIASVASLVAFSSAQLQSILNYHLIPGIALRTDSVQETFPNLQLPSGLVVAPPSAALPPGLRASLFPSRRGTLNWVNNIPVVQANIAAANGIIHKPAALLLPPSTTIKGILASDPTNFSILSAAIVRADSGQVAGPTTQLDSAINFALANLTVFAPTNAAFRAMFPPGLTDAQIIGALNTPSQFTAQQVRALVAYHLLGSRAFSVNFAAGPAPVNTRLVLPPAGTIVPVIVTYGGLNFTVKGLANATPSNVTTRDRHALNGVIHVIDQVLRPQ